VGENKRIRKQLASTKRIQAEHKAKIEAELQKPNPDYGLIAYWSREMKGREKTILCLRSKLAGGN
jgi:hypothetical protein